MYSFYMYNTDSVYVNVSEIILFCCTVICFSYKLSPTSSIFPFVVSLKNSCMLPYSVIFKYICKLINAI